MYRIKFKYRSDFRVILYLPCMDSNHPRHRILPASLEFASEVGQ